MRFHLFLHLRRNSNAIRKCLKIHGSVLISPSGFRRSRAFLCEWTALPEPEATLIYR
jgi:hypothetical protein